MNSQLFTRKIFSSSFYFLLLTALTITVFISCGKDDVIDPIITEDPIENPIDPPVVEIVVTHPADLFTGNISGKVVNKDLTPIEGVNINIKGEETMTDVNGYFYFRNVALDAQGTIVVASQENYWPITKVVVPSKTQENQTRIILQPVAEVSTMEAVDGGVVNFDETIKIDFEPNSFVTISGDAYDGVVAVSALYLDPNDEYFGMMSPGDFRAFNLDSELQTLKSLGMAGVELRGANDEVLELKTGMMATLSIKIPDGATVDEVPLWHFDEESGYWLEEGMAQRAGAFYEGEVTHFSWWNFDIPFLTAKLSGSVINDNGMGIAGLEVSIIMAEDMWNMGSKYTGADGIFCGWIPIDQNLILQIRNECGDVFYEEPIGAFNEDTDLAAITIDGQNIIEVCGNMVNCDEEAVTDGYLVVKHDGHQTFIPVDADGAFCATVNICESTDFELYGVDVTSGLEDLPSAYNLTDSPINDLTLSACDQISTIFRYQINNEPEIIVEDFSIFMDGDILVFENNNQAVELRANAFFEGFEWGTDDFELGFYSLNLESLTTEIECDFFICSAPTIEMIEYGGVGNPIIISIEGLSDEGHEYAVYVNGILE